MGKQYSGAHQSDLIESDIEAYLDSQLNKSLLRFITCGSVDDGKSTLIGRMLYESKLLFEDQLSSLEAESKKMGTQGDDLDFALLVDGLSSEREQGITIDVAYRYFSTDRRKFIVADTPGHEQYTRNMATGASTADLAIILIDARKGILTQTRRHSFIVSLLGIRHVVLAINKMDMVDYSQEVFNDITGAYKEFSKNIPNVEHIEAIPMSALRGDNVVERSDTMDWFHGPTLMSYLHTVDTESHEAKAPFAMPVQIVNRPNSDFRGFSGLISTGSVKPGSRIKVLPSANEATVDRIVTFDGDLDEAIAGQSVVLTLDKEIDISRGDVIVTAESPSQVSDQFDITMLWMVEAPLLPGRPYLIKIGTQYAQATVTSIKYRINVNSMEEVAASQLEMNEIASCHLSLDRRIPFEAYRDNKDLGGFILIDKMTNETIGMGMINFALRRSQNIHLQSFDVDRNIRAGIKSQSPAVLWFTGLSGSGKSTIANILEKQLVAQGRHTILLDGDNVRHGLNRDLGFSDADRVENIRRIGEVAKLMADAGLLVLVSFISPFIAERQMAREMLPDGEFVEIHVNTPLEIAEERDVKGLYKKARAGEIKNFTGIDSPYEAPINPEIMVDTSKISAEDAALLIAEHLEKSGILQPGERG